MAPIWITDADVERLLTVEEAVPVVEAVLRQQAAGAATNMPRGHTIAGPGLMLAHMTAALHEQGVFGFKTYSIVDGRYQFFVLLYSVADGRPARGIRGGIAGTAENRGCFGGEREVHGARGLRRGGDSGHGVPGGGAAGGDMQRASGGAGACVQPQS